MLASQFNEEILPEPEQEVAAYRVRRSVVDYKLFSCYAVDYMDNNLYALVVDVPFEVASNYADSYNNETEPYNEPIDNED